MTNAPVVGVKAEPIINEGVPGIKIFEETLVMGHILEDNLFDIPSIARSLENVK